MCTCTEFKVFGIRGDTSYEQPKNCPILFHGNCWLLFMPSALNYFLATIEWLWIIVSVILSTFYWQIVYCNELKVLAPLSIGFAVFMVHLATIPITGTGINPARSFGAALIYNKAEAWDDHVSALSFDYWLFASLLTLFRCII